LAQKNKLSEAKQVFEPIRKIWVSKEITATRFSLLFARQKVKEKMKRTRIDNFITLFMVYSLNKINTFATNKKTDIP